MFGDWVSMAVLICCCISFNIIKSRSFIEMTLLIFDFVHVKCEPRLEHMIIVVLNLYKVPKLIDF